MTTAAVFQEPSSQIAPDGAPPDPDAPTVDAPYGWTTDPVSGARRPKKTAGRRPRREASEPPAGVSPGLEELRAGATPIERRDDVAPTPARQKVRFTKSQKPGAGPAPAAPAAPSLPPFRAGPIAKGVNKIYRRAGKIIKIWDVPLGVAIISATIKDEPDEDGESPATVGEAWEEIARTNPRIRAFLLKIIEASAIGTLITAHAPILLAIALKPAVQRRIPLMKLANAFLTDDLDDGSEMPSAMAAMLGGINPDDLAQMMAMVMAQASMGMMPDMPRGMNDTGRVEEAV